MIQNTPKIGSTRRRDRRRMVPFAFSSPPELRPWGTPWRSGSAGQESGERPALESASPGSRVPGQQATARRPACFGEKQAGLGAWSAPRRGRERPRGSQAECPLQPETRCGCRGAPRAAATSPAAAAARETDWSCEGGIRGCARHPERNTREEGEEGAKGEGGHDRQTDSDGARAGTGGRKRGRYCRPPTEAHGAVLGPPARSLRRSSGAILGWGGVGRGGNRAARGSHCQLQWGPRGSARLAGLYLGGLSCSLRGSHVALTPGYCPQCTRPTPTPREPALGARGTGGAPGSSGPRLSSANSSGCLPACRCLATFSA